MHSQTKNVSIKSNGFLLKGLWDSVTESVGGITALILPGYSSWKEKKTYVDLSNLCMSMNINTLRIDLYGHGESDGNLTDINFSKIIENIKDSVKFLVDVKGVSRDRIFIIASSFSADPALIYCARNDAIRHLILISPGLGRGLAKTRNNERRDKFYNYIVDFTGVNYSQFADLLGNISTKVHVIHGIDDKRVPVSQSIELEAEIKNCELYRIEGLGHKPETDMQVELRLEIVEKVLRSIVGNF